jgi:DNA-binding CsgD family transcriptional regulator
MTDYSLIPKQSPLYAKIAKRKVLTAYARDPERSLREIADEAGVSHNTAKKYLPNWKSLPNGGLRPTGRREISAEMQRKIVELWRADPTRTRVSIAAELGISPPTVGKYLLPHLPSAEEVERSLAAEVEDV